MPHAFADYRELLALPLDAVSICTPNSYHEPIALAAIAAGKHVLCEKPLALSHEGARRMAETAEAAGVITAVNFRYRFIPSAWFAHDLIAAGELGEIYHVYGDYFNGSMVDPQTPIAWRQARAESGSGALGDLASHLIDLYRYWFGEIAAVQGHLRTFTTERPAPGGGTATVDVDDAATCLLRLASGAEGLVNASRNAAGHSNHQRVEVYGTKGSLVYGIEKVGCRRRPPAPLPRGRAGALRRLRHGPGAAELSGGPSRARDGRLHRRDPQRHPDEPQLRRRRPLPGDTRCDRTFGEGRALDRAGAGELRSLFHKSLWGGWPSCSWRRNTRPARRRRAAGRPLCGPWDARDAALARPLWAAGLVGHGVLTTGAWRRVKVRPGTPDAVVPGAWLFHDATKNRYSPLVQHGRLRRARRRRCGRRVGDARPAPPPRPLIMRSEERALLVL